MKTSEVKPWHFTVVFDEDKARRNGYEMGVLYEYVDKNIEHFGMERVGLGTWQPKDGCDEVLAQCGALSALSKKKWVMENLASLIFFEGDADPIDFIEETRHMHPERVYG